MSRLPDLQRKMKPASLIRPLRTAFGMKDIGHEDETED